MHQLVAWVIDSVRVARNKSSQGRRPAQFGGYTIEHCAIRGDSLSLSITNQNTVRVTLNKIDIFADDDGITCAYLKRDSLLFAVVLRYARSFEAVEPVNLEFTHGEQIRDVLPETRIQLRVDRVLRGIKCYQKTTVFSKQSIA